MKWIIEKFPNLSKVKVPNPEKEHRRALDLIQNFQPVGNQFVYAVSYFDQKLIYLSDVSTRPTTSWIQPTGWLWLVEVLRV